MDSKIIFSALLLFMCFTNAKCIKCYQCESSGADLCYRKEFTDKNNSELKSKPCSSMPSAKYCIKQVFEGGLGTKRFCSALDMGNYCNYVKQPGVDREYRSCVYTCNSDGCNSSNSVNPMIVVLLSSVSILILASS